MLLSKDQLLTLLGVCLVQVAAGIASVWGTSSIYFLSYFHFHDYQVGPLTSSIILIATVVPLAIIVLMATKLSNFIGFENTIRTCSLVFFLSQFVIYAEFTPVTLTIFCLILPISAVTVSLIPSLSCLWSQFPNRKNQSTAATIVCLGLGGILWNIIFVAFSNPDNVPAEIDTEGNAYFSGDVVNHVLPTAKSVFLACSLIFIVGSLLIRKKQKEIEQPRINQEGKKDSMEKQDENIGIEQVCHEPKPGENMMSDREMMPLTPTFDTLTLCQAMKDIRCILLFILLIVVDIFPSYLTNNFKIIFEPAINDDHFLGLCLVLNTTTNIIGTFFWGWLGDRKGTSFSILAVVSVGMFAGALSFFGESRAMVAAFMVAMGLADRGVETLAGPGLAEIFDLRIATELLPFKALGLILGFLFAPLLQVVTSGVFSPYGYLKFLFMFCAISFLIGLYYFIRFRKMEKPPGSKQRKMANQELKTQMGQQDGVQLRQ